MAWYDSYIAKTEGVQGGAPVLSGTRTPVGTIVVLYYDIYERRLKKVHAALPHLTLEQIKAALAYYQDHVAEIEADLDRHQQALAQLRSVS